jgi:hypothetical protein
MSLKEALALFRLLGVHVESVSPSDFTPVISQPLPPQTAIRRVMDLMAPNNAARTAILKSYREPTP